MKISALASKKWLNQENQGTNFDSTPFEMLGHKLGKFLRCFFGRIKETKISF